MAELATFTLSQFQNSLKDLSLTNRFHAENQQHLQNQSRIAFLRAWEFGCHIRQQSFGLGPDAAEGWRELYSVSPHLIRIVSRSHPSELENQSRLRIISSLSHARCHSSRISYGNKLFIALETFGGPIKAPEKHRNILRPKRDVQKKSFNSLPTIFTGVHHNHMPPVRPRSICQCSIRRESRTRDTPCSPVTEFRNTSQHIENTLFKDHSTSLDNVTDIGITNNL